MEVTASLTGFFPRPEEVVAATRDLDRGRTTPESVEALTREAESRIAATEARLGLSPATAGYLRWADLFRPFAETWGGFSVGPITRWFETNTFFRQPILIHPPDRVPGALATHLPAAHGAVDAARAKVLLPGPYTFAGTLDNRSGETSEALIHRLGRLLGDELAELRGRGYAHFQFQEPLLAVRPPTGPAAESVLAAYRSIAEGAKGATTVVWTFFADATPVFPLLARLPVDVIGVDLAETDPAHLPAPARPIGLGLGCVDPRTTLVEEVGALTAVAEAAIGRVRPTRLELGPGGPLDLLPYSAAERKLAVLPAAVRSLNGAGGRP
jgi:5-methyltetrahydropteroyltriglutamate--homocysteine methyltransferase